jgi:hypothetical protein
MYSIEKSGNIVLDRQMWYTKAENVYVTIFYRRERTWRFYRSYMRKRKRNIHCAFWQENEA